MTVHLWRIATESKHHPADDLSGGGAKASGGRWNAPGTAVLYTSENRSLACLETVAHLASAGLPFNRVLVRIDVPDAIWATRNVFDPTDPDNVGWDVEPAGQVSIHTGTAWAAAFAAAGGSALLEVPSVIVPEENNIIINPAHPDAGAITARKIRRWTYDARFQRVSAVVARNG